MGFFYIGVLTLLRVIGNILVSYRDRENLMNDCLLIAQTYLNKKIEKGSFSTAYNCGCMIGVLKSRKMASKPMIDAGAFPHLITLLEDRISTLEALEQEGQEEPFDLWVSKKYVQLHKSATKRGKSFTLTLPQLKKVLRRKTCYYTGVKLTRMIPDGTKPTDLTIERLDNAKGYEVDNIVAVCHAANQLKNELFERLGGELRMTKEMLARFTTKMLMESN